MELEIVVTTIEHNKLFTVCLQLVLVFALIVLGSVDW